MFLTLVQVFADIVKSQSFAKAQLTEDEKSNSEHQVPPTENIYLNS
jgi:hypothetical protein|tara:strand:+ start:224 stop:361 length:138 start_codon:yes stop_codon:yes gene_type:complete